MNIRQAMLMAADHIERHPEAFAPCQAQTKGNLGCPLAWAGEFLGICGATRTLAAIRGWEVSEIVGVNVDRDTAFINEMGQLVGVDFMRMTATDAARAFRLYADRYHPAEPIPPAVREIFNVNIDEPAPTGA